VEFVVDVTHPTLSVVIDALAKTNFTVAESTRPLYRRTRPVPQDPEKSGRDPNFIDLTNATTAADGVTDPVAKAVSLFDARAGRSSTGWKWGVRRPAGGSLA